MSGNSNIRELPLSSVYANPNQPRKDFDPGKLDELAMSIRQYGVLEPIVVTPRDSGYMIIAGERRYRAALLAGLQTINVQVIDADDALVEELALLENIQREDLNIVEEAQGFKSLLDRGWTKTELAAKMGVKQLWRIDERLSLLNLTPEHRKLVVKGVIGNSQAFEMSRLPAAKQGVVLRKIQSGELGTYNKLRAFVDGLIAVENQESIFELTTISDAERESLSTVTALVRNVEKLIAVVHEGERMKHLEKIAFHTDVTAERLDLIIQSLMKIRKSVMAGVGMKEAIAA